MEEVQGYQLGLLVPEVKPMTLETFADAIGVMSKDNIAAILNDPNRFAGRKRFVPKDWIKNQGGRGSCNAYAAAGALERARAYRNKARVKLGPEFLYALINGGRDGGSMLEDGRKTATDVGIPPVEFVKHESYLKSQQSKEAFDNAPRFRIGESFGIHSEEELATALAMNFMCVVAVHVNNNWMRLDGDGVAGGANGPGNHALCAHDVRIKNGVYQFDIPGSWDLNYGDEGHCWTTWRTHFSTTVNYHQFYAIKTTVDDPKGDPTLPKV